MQLSPPLLLAALALVLSLALVSSAGAQEEAEVTLRFAQPMTAILNARAWDQTEQQWNPQVGKELFFDAVHRFLLVRFPDCAAAIHERLQAGYQVKSARLVLTWQNQEFLRVAGYAWRGFRLEGQEPARWHARIWPLRRPWLADANLGPTWNAYLNGAGYWREGGALSTFADRYPQPLADALLWADEPVAEADVTPLLTSPRYGADLGQRLRALADQGFLIAKAELYNREYGEQGMNTSVARVWVQAPELVVVLSRDAAAPPAPALPPAADLPALAATLQQAGGDGVPAMAIPENLPELAQALQEARWAGTPDWMLQRIREIRALPPHYGIDHGYEWFTHMMEAFESGDRERYVAEIDRLLSTPPGYFVGHQHIEQILPLIEYDSLLPDVVRYHLRQGFLTRWQSPLSPGLVFAHDKVLGMGTLNHMANVRPKSLLGAEVTGDTGLARMAQQGLSLLYRMMIFAEGFSQEMGDSYYRGITLGPLQAAAKYSVDPLMRLQASLAVERLLLEDISTYHPALHKRVSRISRRMGANFSQSLLLDQDVPEAALHMLSRNGVMIELDAPGTPPEVEGMQVYNFHSSPPARIALVAPWGRDWESHNIEDKPLPFRSVFTSYVMNRVTEPIHAQTYLGANYGLASEECYTSATVPFQATWQRAPVPVQRLHNLGMMVIQGRVNEEPAGPQELTPFGVLQHNNKAIWAMKPLERKFLLGPETSFPSVKENGLTSLKCQVSLFAYGPEAEREVWVNEQRVTDFPARARLGDLITVKEGVTFLGLRALPTTDLGRREEIVIRQERPLLAIESYLLQSEQPLPDDDATAQRLADATAGWVVELGDTAEYPDFAAFRRHLSQAQLQANWQPEERVLHLAYTSGADKLEMGFRTTFEREVLWHQQLNPSRIFAYQRVNGAWPWPERGIDLDSPLAQMGKAGRLEKGGAVLETAEGRMSLLRVEPITGTYEGVNPFVDPTPFTLRTPQGPMVRAEGLLGCGRVTFRPAEGRLWVDYQLPPPTGNVGDMDLQAREPKWYPEGVDTVEARRQSARALLVTGLDQAPEVVLNGQRLAGPFAKFTRAGQTWWRVPIVREMPVR